MKFVLLTFCILSFVSSIVGQQIPVPTPRPAPAPTPVRTSVTRAIGPFEDQTKASHLDPAQASRLRLILLDHYARPLYRKPDKRELQALAVAPDVRNKFAAFLNGPNTGIFKLIVDWGCDEKVQIVNASEQCLKYSMPGGGNSFSFRTMSHRLRRIADLTFRNGNFSIPGVLMQGIIVNLGDVPIESVSLTSPGVDSLNEFRPSSDISSAMAVDRVITTGVRRASYTFSRSAAVEVNSTYGIRSIAFRGRVSRAVRGAAYNELDYDSRRDVIVVFRVVDRDAEGNLTIVWRELRNIESPRIKPAADTKGAAKPNIAP